MKPLLAIRMLAGTLLLSTGIRGQSLVPPSSHLSFQNFNYENGLSDNYISDINQDSRGFIWISTPEGLNRFDGISFKKFSRKKEHKGQIISNRVRQVFEYRQNRLLVVADRGISSFNTRDQQFSTTGNPVLDTSVVLAAVHEPGKQTWIVLIESILVIDSAFRIVRKYTDPNGKYTNILTIHRMKDGRMLVTRRDNVFYLDEKTGSLLPISVEIPGASSITHPSASYYSASDHVLYVFEWNKPSLRIDLNMKKTFSIPWQANLSSVLRDSRGYTWLCTNNGLYQLNEKTGWISHYLHLPIEKTSLVSNSVLNVFEDRDKNLWIGTMEGLSKLSNRALTMTSFNREFYWNGQMAEIYDINRSADGRIFIATFGNGVFSIDKQNKIRQYLQRSIPLAWSVRPESDRVIVTGHQKMIAEIDLSTGKEKMLPLLQRFRDSADLTVFSYRDSRGGEWYSINRQMGLFHKNAVDTGYHHYSPKGVSAPFDHSYFSMATEDGKGRIWFGMNKRSDFVSYDFNTGSFKNHYLGKITSTHLAGVNCLLGDKNVVWIGTHGTGLIRYIPDSGSARAFTIEDGLSSNSITSLVFDGAHRLWVGTSRGLSCLLPGQDRFIHFSRSDGFPEIYFGEGASFYDSSTNRLYTAAKATLTVFDPDQFLGSIRQTRSLYVDEVKVNYERVSLPSGLPLKLKHNENNLSFSFTAIDFENARNLLFSYKLEGADKDWIEAGEQRVASYTNLSHGQYRFLVRTNQPGSPDFLQTEAPLVLNIIPPYWKTWWFRLLIAVLTGAGLYLLVKSYYQRKMNRQRLAFEKQKLIEQERTRIATDMHDDLGAGLSRIRFLSQALYKKQGDEENLRSGLEKITGYSAEMIEKMGEIVWALNEKNDTLADLVAFTRAYAVEYLQMHQLTCEADTPMQLPGSFIPGEFRRNIFLAVKESLHNIVKHANAEKVQFVVRLNGGIEIIIHDNGKGIDWEKTRAFSNGVNNIQKRMEEIRGKALIENDHGTKVTLQAPLSI